VKAKTYLSLTQTAQGAMCRKEAQERERKRKLSAASSRNRMASAEIQRVIKLGLQTSSRFSEQRAAHVEALRVQVKAGTYQIDSWTLAEKILLPTSYVDCND
jgi:anti-sigma28 factor (negative regulator of flagellin synthesis)